MKDDAAAVLKNGEQIKARYIEDLPRLRQHWGAPAAREWSSGRSQGLDSYDMTVASACTNRRARRLGFDVSKPVLYAFAVILCVLIVMPLSWLVYTCLHQQERRIHPRQFPSAASDAAYLDPLLTTFALATLIGVDLLRGGGAHGLAGGAYRYAACVVRCGFW